MRRILILAVICALLVPANAVSTNAQGQNPKKLALEPCKLALGFGKDTTDTDAQCGTYAVPEDWSKPDGRKLNIHVTVLPAPNASAKRAPIFHFEGGPGAAASKQFANVWFGAYTHLRENHDIVLIDQRGTGQSASLQCTEITETALADLAVTKPDVSELDKLQTCLKRIVPIADPVNVTSLALAADTNAIREALGYDKINIFGTSYGTWLAQFYAARYANTINAMVLEGTVGPWDEPFLSAGLSAEGALRRAFATCEQDAVCNKAFPNLQERFLALLASLKNKPVSTSGLSALNLKAYPIIVTPERFVDGLTALISQGITLGAIPQIIAQAEAGTFTTLAAALVAAAEQSDAVSLGMYWSITCAEMFAFYSKAKIDDAIKLADKSLFQIGKEFLSAAPVICRTWRSAELSPAEVSAPSVDVPLLLMAGAFDPVTPPIYAQNTAKRFKNSTLATFAYQGHGILPMSKCAQNLAQRFFEAPTAKLDISCAANDPKPVFSGTYSLPKLIAYTDPKSGAVVKIPDGWARQPNKIDGPMLFFAGDGQQFLGIESLKNTDPDLARQEAEAAAAVQYGTLIKQASLSQSGIVINQYSIDGPDQLLTGVLVVIPPLSGTTRILWYAAPNNVFNATFEAIFSVMLIALMTSS